MPWLMVPHADVSKMLLDPRSVFILPHVDGMLNVDMSVDVAGIPKDQVLGIVIDLACMGAIALR